MRENSGAADARTQTRDPTLQDKDDQGIPGRRSGDQTDGAAFDFGQDVGEQSSPSNRQRGETASTDADLPVDQNR
jgi:hypothetical protein